MIRVFKKLHLGLVPYPSGHQFNAGALQVEHQVGLDAESVPEQQIFQVQELCMILAPILLIRHYNSLVNHCLCMLI